ncbi:membrane-associated protein, putative [Bodo saltans]|uniref:Membrane-associated protein, putative n=1 Tax=Bodo saltans TaxID=75058 RepID=A0A0S4JIV2_BODSA|nr:membrane-associated protein, putative [Bodo saltans]|eukprot:CUG90093.1 membrane-associated protein, putative [Bodo saltans]
MRFGTGRLLRRLKLDNKSSTLVNRMLRRLQALTPPSGPVTLSWTGYMFLLCPTVSLCVALVSDEAMPAYARLVGGLMLPLWFVPWAGAFIGLCWRGKRVEFAFFGMVASRVNEKRKRVSRRRHVCSLPTFREARAWLFEETEELAPRRGVHKELKELATEQLRRFGSVFAGYRAARYWCFNVEVGFAIATGVATGLMLRQMSSTDPCAGSGWAWAVVGVGILETTTALILRSFALRLELVVFVSVMVFTILSEVVALTNPAAMNSSNALAVVSAILQLCLILHGVLEHLLLRHRMARTHAVMAEGKATGASEGFLELSEPIRQGGRRALLNSTQEAIRIERSLADIIEMICAQRSCT